MKTLKVFLFVLCSIFYWGEGIAQNNKSTLDLLCQNDWTHTYSIPNDEVIVTRDVFTPTTMTQYTLYNGVETKLVPCNYYLSDQIETSFDPDKIGLVKDGRYIIRKDSFSRIIVWEILSISETEFEFAQIKNDPATRGAMDQQKVKYTAIPK